MFVWGGKARRAVRHGSKEVSYEEKEDSEIVYK